MGDTEEFNPLTFEKRLANLKDTQECIQGLSSWCLKQRSHHKKIVASWLNVLKRVKIEQRLILFYLANDVIQYSKRKNYEFVESWGLNLQKATPLVRDEKVRPKILRIFKIWEQRSVYDDEFLSDLTGLLSAGAVKKTDDDPLDFQPQQLVNKIKQCQDLETDTDLKLKHIHECPLKLNDTEALCTYLKDKSHKEDTHKELNDGILRVEKYTQALQREIVAREALLALLTSANQYYSTQRGEVKVVAYAYKNFGSRVRALKRKLDELIPTLPNAAPSPPPRDEDVPSPGPDEDLELPPPTETEDDISYNIDRTFNTSLAADGSLYNLGLSSFLSSDNPLAMFNEGDVSSSANKIEVLNTRPNEKQDFNINDFLKTFVPNESNMVATPDNNSVASGTLSQKSQDALPGLDLLTPESTGNPAPPTSFYGSIDLINGVVTPASDEPEPYLPERTNNWNNNAWSIPAPPALPVSLGMHVSDTPESPPPVPAPVPPPNRIYTPSQDLPSLDVDHRGVLPPPPPPPVLPMLGLMHAEDEFMSLLGKCPSIPLEKIEKPWHDIEDVDHRLLPPVAPPVAAQNRLPVVHQDVDHRNLIPLTHQPPVPLNLNHPPPPVPRPTINLDQDYRVPPMVPPVLAPPDIVESVDMDLSEDEEHQGMYNHSENRRFNNKVLVGGDNGKTHPDKNHSNFIQINDKKDPHTAPALSQMVNPFDVMPPNPSRRTNSYDNVIDLDDEGSNDAYNDDLRSRGFDDEEEYDDFDYNRQRPAQNRFPRNWTPRNFRPQGPFPSQGRFHPPMGPRQRWNGPRQRFW